MPTPRHNTFDFYRYVKSGRDLQDQSLRREERTKREGSPDYTYTLAALASTARITMCPEKDFPASLAYGYLDTLVFTNNDSVDLTLTLNGDITQYCPAGVVLKIKDRPIRSLTVYNGGAVITTLGKVVAVLSRAPTNVDRVAQGR